MVAKQLSWQCPFCGQVATIRGGDRHSDCSTLTIENAVGRVTLRWFFIVCPNDQCGQFTLKADLWRSVNQATIGGEALVGEGPLKSWKLIPASNAKVLPDYVPPPIVCDYQEACAIRDLSPKASATLARRCLQGMIRNFWDISKSRLIDEIEALREKVDSEIWKAIDAVRETGNIGAHMEKDINVIVDVDPKEAGLLIGLIEMLVDEWYVARHDRQQRVQEVIELGKAKKEQRKARPASQE